MVYGAGCVMPESESLIGTHAPVSDRLDSPDCRAHRQGLAAVFIHFFSVSGRFGGKSPILHRRRSILERRTSSRSRTPDWFLR